MAATHTFDYGGPEGVAYHEHRQLPAEAEKWVAKIRAAKLQPYIKGTDSVFEYGVGFAWNLMELRCERKVGFDVAPNLRPTVESRGVQFVEELKALPAGAFDVALCHHTLEHLLNPAEALQFMKSILRDGGRLLVFVPYEIERKYRRHHLQDKAHHLYSWTPLTLSNLVLAQGFALELTRVRKFRFDRIAAVAARKLRLGERGYRFIRSLGLLLLPEYEISVIATKPVSRDSGNSSSACL